MFLDPLRTTTAQENCDEVVAMGEMLLSCYLYYDIMVHQHQMVLSVTSITTVDVHRATICFQKFQPAI